MDNHFQDNAMQVNISGGTVNFAGNEKKKHELVELAEKLRLIGKQKHVVVQVAETDDLKYPIADLALELKWPNPEDNFNSIRKELNKKFDPHGWKFERDDGEATAIKIGQK